ncbi:MAG: ammonium transporter [Cyclobacteriaceae bacterium]
MNWITFLVAEATKTTTGAQAIVRAIKSSKVLIDENTYKIDNLWIVVAGFMVFMMHLGFAMLETGLTRSKNTTNVLYKNALVPCIAFLTYIIGYNFLYPGFTEDSLGVVGFKGFGLERLNLERAGLSGWSVFFYQALFTATATTIVSGAVAERIKLSAFIVFAFLFMILVYPIIGSWTWGNGWLAGLGFHDFAGGTVVHSVGGAAALAAVAQLGSRLGKFNGKVVLPLPGHNMSSATIGAFLLWFGWIGFNGGSLSLEDNTMADVAKVIVITMISGAAGGVVAHFVIYFIGGSFDLSMLLNGILAGLVSITAGADQMSFIEAIIIGGIAGGIVVPSIFMFESLKIDDPVGALSVHLVCGFFGTLCVGIFGDKAGISQLVIQLIGFFASVTASFIATSIIFYLVKVSIGIRVSKEQELTGLDLTEHGMKAYTFVSK